MLRAAVLPRPSARPDSAPQERPGGLLNSLKGYLTRPYQTLFVQIFSSRTDLPGFGECQI
ncbi:hypothetical protein GCM10010219_11600 [Streptomyces netropsis]|nr:hypothetical protein GCM10010219_11600 [Streptomyces netropsis]